MTAQCEERPLTLSSLPRYGKQFFAIILCVDLKETNDAFTFNIYDTPTFGGLSIRCYYIRTV
jgi:hypothetical protein